MHKIRFLAIFEFTDTRFFICLNIFDLAFYAIFLALFFYLTELLDIFYTLYIAIAVCFIVLLTGIGSLTIFILKGYRFEPDYHHFYNWTRGLASGLIFCIGVYVCMYILYFGNIDFFITLSLRHMIGVFLVSVALAALAMTVYLSIILRKILKDHIRVKRATTKSMKEKADKTLQHMC